MTIEVTTLDNGLRIASDAMEHLETTSVGVWIDVGARDEAPELNGISHLLEHMAFKGTTRRTTQQIAEEIEAVGGHLNAYTSREQTAYFARVLGEDVPLALDILADILQHALFEDDELARERHVIIQEIGQTEDTPDDVIFDYFQETAFPDQPLGRSILGTAQGVSGMTRDNLIAYMRTYYHAPAMVVAAAGRIDHSELVALAESVFETLAASNDKTRGPARYGGGDFREERELEQVHFTLGFPGVSYTDPDFYAVSVLATLLGGGMSSRLFQEVREKRGLAYAIGAHTSSYIDGGLFGVYAGTGATEIAELVPVVCDEIASVAVRVEEDELARSRAQLKAGLMMALEASSTRCEQLARQLQVYGRPIPPSEIVAKIDAVDAAAVSAAGERLITGAPPVVAAIGPIGRLESYDRIAARFA